LDVSKGQHKEKLAIEIRSDDEGITFRHNAGWFSDKEYRALVEAYSTKPFERDSNFAGRFATGFLVCHIIDKKVAVKGTLNQGGELSQFSIEIDRESNQIETLLENFDKSFNALDNAILLNNSLPDYWTEYSFRIRDNIAKKAVEIGITELKKSIPFLLVFDKIDYIDVNGENYSLENPKKENDAIIIDTIKSKEIWHMPEENVDIGLLIDTQTKRIDALNDSPRIFVHGLPLIESGSYLKIPFVVHSNSFDVTEERDVLTNTDKNKEILSKAFECYKKIAECISQTRDEKIQNLFFLSDFRLIHESESLHSELLEHTNTLITATLKNIIDNLPIVDTVGKGNITIKDSMFPTRTINNKIIPDEYFEQFYSILSTIKNEIPVKVDLESWIILSSALQEEFDDIVKITFFGIGDLKDSIEKLGKDKNLPGLSDITDGYGVKAPKDFLLSFLKLLNGLYEKEIIDTCHFIDKLILDQSGVIGPYNWGELGLYIDHEIEEDLKEIFSKIGWEIKQNLVDKEFSKYKIVTDLVNKYLKTDGALKLLIENYPLKGKITEDVSQWTDSTNGWIDIFRWCLLNQIMPIGMFVITKDTQENRIQKIISLDEEYFIIPFKYIAIDEQYEKIFPESHVLHKQYFEFDGAVENRVL
jgi:hypothetical protein